VLAKICCHHCSSAPLPHGGATLSELANVTAKHASDLPRKLRIDFFGDRTQNAHRICNPSGACGLCGSSNQQLADNRARRMVQLRPWPPHFKGFNCTSHSSYYRLLLHYHRSIQRVGFLVTEQKLKKLSLRQQPVFRYRLGVDFESRFQALVPQDLLHRLDINFHLHQD
jgi:hypothetical protein